MVSLACSYPQKMRRYVSLPSSSKPSGGLTKRIGASSPLSPPAYRSWRPHRSPEKPPRRPRRNRSNRPPQILPAMLRRPHSPGPGGGGYSGAERGGLPHDLVLARRGGRLLERHDARDGRTPRGARPSVAGGVRLRAVVGCGGPVLLLVGGVA